MNHDEHVARYIEAIALGHYADCVFEDECRRLGLSIEESLRTPLDSVTMPLSAGGGHVH